MSTFGQPLTANCWCPPLCPSSCLSPPKLKDNWRISFLIPWLFQSRAWDVHPEVLGSSSVPKASGLRASSVPPRRQWYIQGFTIATSTRRPEIVSPSRLELRGVWIWKRNLMFHWKSSRFYMVKHGQAVKLA